MFKKIVASLVLVFILVPILTKNISFFGLEKILARIQNQMTAGLFVSCLDSSDNSSTSNVSCTEISGLFVEQPNSNEHANSFSNAVKREKTFKINNSLLDGTKLKKGVQIDIPLFSDAKFKGRVEEIIFRLPTSFTLIGTINRDRAGKFYWTREGDASSIDISSSDGLYEVRPVSNGKHVVSEINEDKLPPYDDTLLVDNDIVSTGTLDTSSSSVDSSGNTIVDVLVVYTPAARIAAGGVSGITSNIRLAVDKANQAYLNSGVKIKLNLVGPNGDPYEVAGYTETGDSHVDLSRLAGTSDGYMDEVHNLRNTYGADLVNLIGQNIGSVCGTAYLMRSVSLSFASSAFSVVARGCISNHSFAHELGHNMGAAHDVANASSAGAYPYSYGWRWAGSSGAVFRSIMSYSPGTRINYFSNPAVLYDGIPTGVNEANNSLTLNNTAPTVSQFRNSPDLISPLVSITNPVSGSTYISSQILPISVLASDNVGIARVEFYDNDTIKGTINSAPYSYNWNINSTNNGAHRWTAKVYDTSGNNAISDPVGINVDIPNLDDVAPVVTIVSPAASSTVSGVVNVSVNATDNLGVSSVEFYLDNVLKTTKSVTPYVFAWDTKTVVDGVYSLKSKAYDIVGNVGIAGPLNVIVKNASLVDTIPPLVTIKGPSVISNKNKTFTASSSDNVGVAKVEFYLDSATAPFITDTSMPYSATINTKKLSVGSHIIFAKAYDLSGNTASSSMSFSYGLAYNLFNQLANILVSVGTILGLR